MRLCRLKHILARLTCAGVLAAGAAWAQAPPATPIEPTQAESSTSGVSRTEIFRQVDALKNIGQRMFHDTALSGSGQMSCASCHSDAHAFGPPNALSVQRGGKDLRGSGLRAVPTLTYKQATPQFTEHFHESDDEGDESVDGGPTGGLNWDGRVDHGRDQALFPLLSAEEMANVDRDALQAIIELRYGAALRSAFGPRMPQGPEATLKAGVKALEVFEQDPTSFYPYSSKYDSVLAGKAHLSPLEARGLAAFNDETKGNCAQCHPSTPAGDSSAPQFTDYGLIALGVPRNPDIDANRDPNFYDLGLCGQLRQDFKTVPEYCGLFKAPTLRNVATRKSFFHNGVFHSLKEVMDFYVERDLHPEKFYPRNSDGSVRRYDDLPSQFHGNVNVEPPFDRKLGDAPALNAEDIDAIIAFLGTLTDGYDADAPVSSSH